MGRGSLPKPDLHPVLGLEEWVVCNIDTGFRQRQTMSCRETAKCRRTNAINTETQAKRKQNDFRINYLQNYESESESKIRGEESISVIMNAKDHLSQLISLRKRKRQNIWGN